MIFLVVLLIALWYFGYISIPSIPFLKNTILFSFNHFAVTIWDLLIFIVIMWAVNILPSPLRQIGWALTVLWLLGLFGIIAIANFSTVILWAIIIGLVLAVLKVI